MTLTPQMEAALAEFGILPFCAIKIELPGATVRILDGAGRLTIFGEVYTGRDAVYGTLMTIDGTEVGTAEDAPNLRIGLAPASDAAAADLADPLAQLSPVTVYLGLVDVATGTVVADPVTEFVGFIDAPVLHIDRGAVARLLEYQVVSVFELFFAQNEGVALSNSFHNSLYPGERGFEYTTAVARQLPWGTDAPRPALITTASGADRERPLPGSFIGDSY